MLSSQHYLHVDKWERAIVTNIIGTFRHSLKDYYRPKSKCYLATMGPSHKELKERICTHGLNLNYNLINVNQILEITGRNVAIRMSKAF